MNRDAMFELRVLTGTHAGARALVAQSEQVLGSDPECDLVLSDEGVLARHARLELREDGASVLSWLDGDLDPLVIRPGQGAAIGPVTIAIDAADAPWSPEVEMVAPLARQALPDGASPGLEETAGSDDAAESAAAPTPAAVPQALPASAGAGLARRVRTSLPLRAALATLGVALVAGGAATAWWALGDGLTEATGQPLLAAGAAPAQTQDPTASLQALRLKVSELQLEDRVRIEASGHHPPSVHASLLSDEEAENLAAALTRMSPRPRLRLESEHDVISAIQDVLGRLEGSGGTGLKAIYLGQGRLRIEGQVTSDEARASLMAGLARDFPLVRSFEAALMTPGDSGQAMLADLKAQGVGDIEGQWQDGVLQLKAKVLPSSLPRWEAALQQAAARHGVSFRAEVDTAGAQAGASRARALPFSVRSIVSGDPSYVTLADGRRLVVDGRAEGWRLVEIGARQVIFEDSGGRRVSMER